MVFLRTQKGCAKSEQGQVSAEFIITIMIVLGVFVFGLFIFQSRSALNTTATHQWEAQDVAYRFARNINNVYVLDENAVLMDTLYWEESARSVTHESRSVLVYYGSTVADASLATNNVTWNITDVNGLIYFKKTNQGVVVGYD